MTVTADRQLEYRDLLLTAPFHVQRVDGLVGLPDLRTGDRALLGRHGLHPGTDLLAGRRISLTIDVVTFDPDTFHEAITDLQAAFTLGLDDVLQRSLLWDCCRRALVDPWKLSIDELGAMLPQIEQQLRLVGLPDQASAAIARLRTFIFDWEE